VPTRLIHKHQYVFTWVTPPDFSRKRGGRSRGGVVRQQKTLAAFQTGIPETPNTRCARRCWRKAGFEIAVSNQHPDPPKPPEDVPKKGETCPWYGQNDFFGVGVGQNAYNANLDVIRRLSYVFCAVGCLRLNPRSAGILRLALLNPRCCWFCAWFLGLFLEPESGDGAPLEPGDEAAAFDTL
jgi:hypothetical protein